MIRKAFFSLVTLVPMFGFTITLNVDDVQSQVIDNNYSLAAAKEAYLAANRERQKTLTNNFPQVSYTGSARKLEEPSSFFNQKELYYSSISCSQVLFSTDTFFGYLASSYGAKQALAQAFSLGNELLTKAKVAYYTVVLNKEAVHIQEEEVDLLKKSVKDNELLLKEGYSTNVDLLQSQVALSESLSKYYDALKAYKQSKVALLEILGDDVSQYEEVKVQDEEIHIEKYVELNKLVDQIDLKLKENEVDLDKIVSSSREKMREAFTQGILPKPLKEEWIQIALKNNPEIDLSKNAIGKAKSNFYKEVGKFTPTIAAKASYTGPEGSGTSFGNLNYRWEFALSLNWSLFDSFGREFGISQKRHLLAKEKASLKEIENHVRARIENQFSAFEESVIKYFVAKEAVSLADENIQLAKLQRRESLITNLDYLQMVNARRDVQHIFRQSAFALIVAYFDIEKEMGGNIKKIMENI